VRRRLFAAAAAIHLVIAALFSTHVRIEDFIPAAIERPLQIYGGYTGAATRFNFFAPAVPTQPRVQFILALRDGSTRTVDLLTPNGEANQRLANMFGLYELVELRPVLLRTWAVFALTHHPEAQAVEVHVDLLDIPTIAQARNGKAATWVEAGRMTVRRDEIS